MSKHIVIDARIRPSSTGRYIDRLIEHLQKIDKVNNYTVLVNEKDAWQPTAGNFKVMRVPFAQFSFSPMADIRFARFLTSLKPDLVHFAMTQQPLTYRGKVVTTTHDLTMLRFVRAGTTPLPIFWLKRAGYRLIMSGAHRKSAAIIAPTQYVADDIIRLQPFTRRKVTVTLESSEPPLKDTAARPKSVVQNDKFILAVGSAFPHKNLQGLVDAHAILQKKYPDLKLFFAGKKEYHYGLLDSYIEQKANTNNVKTLGFVSDAELKWLYQNCAVYVFPSFSEGFGLPGLEAMVHGAPVASSSATCLPEVYGDAALYFDPHSPTDMANKISTILEDKLVRLRLIKKGYVQAGKFSWRRMAEQTLAIYNSVLEK